MILQSGFTEIEEDPRKKYSSEDKGNIVSSGTKSDEKSNQKKVERD